MQGPVLFSEKQYFRQGWFMLLLGGLNVLAIVGCIVQLGLKQTVGDRPLPDAGLVAVALFLLFVTYGLLRLRLETVMRAEGIYVRFYPFQHSFQFFAWNDIQSVHVRLYRPLGEYGGWGLRGCGDNQALNVSGNQGIQVLTRSGKKLLIGTQKPEEAAHILRQLGLSKELAH